MESHGSSYDMIIEAVFFAHFVEGGKEFYFNRMEIEETAKQIGVSVPKNIGDVIYTYRYRQKLPQRVLDSAPRGKQWVIRSAGYGKYKFGLTALAVVNPTPGLVETKILNATPGVIARYSLTDEQALLAIVRYNRLLDIFTGTTCYSLQSHLRTTVSDLGQVEVDELYIGVDSRGAHYAIPIQAKGWKDIIGIVQIEQDFAVCKEKFPLLIPRPVAVQFMTENLIAMIEFEQDNCGEVAISGEKHYKIVEQDELTDEELKIYKSRRYDDHKQ